MLGPKILTLSTIRRGRLLLPGPHYSYHGIATTTRFCSLKCSLAEHQQRRRTFATQRQKRVAAEAAATVSEENANEPSSNKDESVLANDAAIASANTTTNTATTSGNELSGASRSNSHALHSTLGPQEPIQEQTQHQPPARQQQQPLILDRLGNPLPNSSFAAQQDDQNDLLSTGLVLDTTITQQELGLLMPTAPTDWTGYQVATPLSQEFMGRIVMAGRPLSIADYMRAALTHPDAGYYTTGKNNTASPDNDDFDRDDYDITETTTTTVAKNEVIGPAGDFITAPEVSQVFGECLGVWFYTQWQQQQHADADATTTDSMSFQWLECGPGNGSLMVDLLQFSKQLQIKDAHVHATNTNKRHEFWIEYCSAIHLVEASPVMQAKQQEALQQWQQQQHKSCGVDESSSVTSKHATCPTISFEFHNHKSDRSRNSSSNELRIQDTKGVVNENPASKLTNDDTSGTPSTTNNTSSQHRNTHCISVHWHDSLQTFMFWQQKQQQSLRPTFALCQEFLDALPIYSFEKTREGYWRERLVDVALREDLIEDNENESIDETSMNRMPKASSTVAEGSCSSDQDSSSRKPQEKKPRLRIVLAPEATPALKTLLRADQEGFVEDPVLKDAPVGSVVEVSPDGMIVMQDLAKIVQEQGGAALVIDYGQEGSTDSIRAFSKHKQVHFLSHPGQVDVTADVDFAAMRRAVNDANRIGSAFENNSSDKKRNSETVKARAFGPSDQGEFLMAMGMQERVIQLIERDDVTDEKAEDLFNAMVRLASPEEMGKRYKVMCIVPMSKDADLPPPGFVQ